MVTDLALVRRAAGLSAVGGAFIALTGAIQMVSTSYLLGIGLPPNGALRVGTAGTALVFGTVGLVVGVGVVGLALVARSSPDPRPIGTGLLVLSFGSLLTAFGGLFVGFLLVFAGAWLMRRGGRRPAPAVADV